MAPSSVGVIRPYDHRRDEESALRVWYECGWLEKDNASHLASYHSEREASDVLVYEESGAAEAVVFSTPAQCRHGEEDLPMTAVAALTVSRVARKRGIASRLLATAIADGFDNGYSSAGTVTASDLAQQRTFIRYGLTPHVSLFRRSKGLRNGFWLNSGKRCIWRDWLSGGFTGLPF